LLLPLSSGWVKFIMVPLHLSRPNLFSSVIHDELCSVIFLFCVGGVVLRKRKEILLVLCTIAMIMMIGIGIVSPILPHYARSFGVNITMVGLLITVFGLARIAIDVPAGSWLRSLADDPCWCWGLPYWGSHPSAVAWQEATYSFYVLGSCRDWDRVYIRLPRWSCSPILAM